MIPSQFFFKSKLVVLKKCIDNIIFDLGGVLFDIEYHKTFEQLGLLLGIDLSINNWPPGFKKVVHAYETGSIKTETFLWKKKVSIKPEFFF